MSLAIRIRFLTGRYEAAVDRVRAEWPPHPARVFCALAATASGVDDDSVLGWLESLPAPEVWTSAAPLQSTRRRAYVVVNEVANRPSHSMHLGRRGIDWLRVGVTVPGPYVDLVWPTVEPEPGLLASLQSLALRVGYLGRSSSLVLIQGLSPAPADSGAVRFLPTTLDDSEGGPLVDLRVPYPGYLEALRQTHLAGGNAWEVARPRPYRLSSSPSAARVIAPVSSPWSPVVVLGLPAGLRVSGRVLARATAALRRAVLERYTKEVHDLRDVPPTISGHGASGRAHLAFLGLPDVGHSHADGHLLGLAVAMPRDLESGDLAALARILTAPPTGVTSIALPGLGVLELQYDPFRTRPKGLLLERWTRPSRRWVSVTPMVLDRHPKHGDWDAAVRQSAELAGFPVCRVLRAGTAPLIPGGVWLATRELPHRQSGDPPLAHAELEFTVPVVGPLVLGRLRHLGLGLFAPADFRPE